MNNSSGDAGSSQTQGQSMDQLGGQQMKQQQQQQQREAYEEAKQTLLHNALDQNALARYI